VHYKVANVGVETWERWSEMADTWSLPGHAQRLLDTLKLSDAAITIVKKT